MTMTQITYGKSLTIIKHDFFNANNRMVFSSKIGNLESIISDLECFAITLTVSKLKKTLEKIKSLGFDVDVDHNHGFEFECKVYCTK